MSFCPEHGPEMELIAESSSVVVYLCHEGPEVWTYSGDIPGYLVKDVSVGSGDCPKCLRTGTPLVDCMGDAPDLCPKCWAEHEFGAPPAAPEDICPGCSRPVETCMCVRIDEFSL
ncbi:MAG: hypothetical protein HY531_02765 [Chloroflexi bacterium]|nr:hypothetical protein [Chloroflexota bacterium]